jgi:transposase-like protein
MGMPQLIVTSVLVEGRSKSEVAREYGVSRRWVITVVQRYLAEGEAGLQPRSRRPHRQPTRTASAVEEEIIAIRKDLDKHGHEAGAATIAAHLAARNTHAPRGVDDLADPDRPRVRHPATTQAPQSQLRGPITHRPAARLNASTRPSRNG